MSQKSVCIVAHSYLRPCGQGLQIGGVQTYVDALRSVLARYPVSVDILQPAAVDFEKRLSGRARVIGIRGGFGRLRRAYQRHFSGRYSLTVFATLLWAEWAKGEPSVAIQHGIHWDGFNTRFRGVADLLHRRYRAIQLWRERRLTCQALDNVSEVVCVDLNFPNWLRATFPFRRWEEKLTYVPNFGQPIRREQLADKQCRSGDRLRVLIARRFEAYRGVPLFAGIVQEIAGRYPHCRFLFAGSGSRERELRSMLAGLDNCEIRAVPRDRMQQVCWEADVAVVPTLYSEGTSLSAIEAMCAANAVLATGVGGLGNLILPNYNGLLVEPTRDALKAGLLRLLDDSPLRRKLGRNAYQTACECFSYEAWQRRMLAIFTRHLGAIESLPERREKLLALCQ